MPALSEKYTVDLNLLFAVVFGLAAVQRQLVFYYKALQ